MAALWRVVLTFEHIYFFDKKNCSSTLPELQNFIVTLSQEKDATTTKTKCFRNAFYIFLISLVFSK